MNLNIKLSSLDVLKDMIKSTKLVQERLNAHGANLKLDGVMGSKTLKAIKAFQRKNKMNGSGTLGPKTIKLLGITASISLDKMPNSDIPKKTPKKLKPTTGKVLAMYPNKRLLTIASKELGVKEVRGKGNNPRVVLYHAYSTVANKKGMDDSVPWCASAMCFVVEMSGLESTNSKMARSFERGGYKRVTNTALPGDIVTFYRNGKKSGSGHVGMLVKETANYVYVMGGNQSDAFNIKKFSKAKMTGIWRVHSDVISLDQERDLKKMGAALVAGKKIDMAGKVV